MVNIKCKFYPYCKKYNCKYSHPVDKGIDATFLDYINKKLSLNEEKYIKYNILKYENEYIDIFYNIRNIQEVDDNILDELIEKINAINTSLITNLEYFKTYKYTPKKETFDIQDPLFSIEHNNNYVDEQIINDKLKEISPQCIENHKINVEKDDFQKYYHNDEYIKKNILDNYLQNEELIFNKQVNNNTIDNLINNSFSKPKKVTLGDAYLNAYNNGIKKINNKQDEMKFIKNTNKLINKLYKKENRKRTHDLDYWKNFLNKDIILINDVKANNEVHYHCSEIINNEVNIYKKLAEIGKLCYDMKPKELLRNSYMIQFCYYC